jgi:hypothetical protein
MLTCPKRSEGHVPQAGAIAEQHWPVVRSAGTPLFLARILVVLYVFVFLIFYNSIEILKT